MAINLSKGGDQHKIDLSKGSTNITVHANLNWNQEVKQTGFFAKLLGGGGAPDLDLGCMLELTTGQIMCIQPLGNSFGSKTAPPFLYLDKDDRTGESKDGENMYMLRPETIKRAMFFALIYQGAPNFQSVGGHMRFKISNGEEVTLSLNNPDASSKFCAAALFENRHGEYFLTKEERYFAGHEQADKHYKFGFRWTAGHK